MAKKAKTKKRQRAEVFPRRVYMDYLGVSANAYRITFKRVADPIKEMTVIVLALNLEEAAWKIKEAWKSDFSHLIHIESLQLRGIA